MMMKRLLRWIGMALRSLLALGFIAYAVVYVLSERILRRTYEVPAVAISIPTDPASIIEGRRLAIIRGCFGGCQGKQAEGIVMIDETPVEGVGDDAYYIENPSFTSINVKKGTSAFEVHVRGASAAQLKPILKTLAQQAASKL